MKMTMMKAMTAPSVLMRSKSKFVLKTCSETSMNISGMNDKEKKKARSIDHGICVARNGWMDLFLLC